MTTATDTVFAVAQGWQSRALEAEERADQWQDIAERALNTAESANATTISYRDMAATSHAQAERLMHLNAVLRNQNRWTIRLPWKKRTS